MLSTITTTLTQFGAARVTRIHCDENSNRRHQRYRIAHEDKRRFIILLARNTVINEESTYCSDDMTIACHQHQSHQHQTKRLPIRNFVFCSMFLFIFSVRAPKTDFVQFFFVFAFLFCSFLCVWDDATRCL